jgi:hypothetical protein
MIDSFANVHGESFNTARSVPGIKLTEPSYPNNFWGMLRSAWPLFALIRSHPCAALSWCTLCNKYATLTRAICYSFLNFHPKNHTIIHQRRHGAENGVLCPTQRQKAPTCSCKASNASCLVPCDCNYESPRAINKNTRAHLRDSLWDFRTQSSSTP